MRSDRKLQLIIAIISLVLHAIFATAEAKASDGRKMQKLYVMNQCSQELCYYQTIPKGWHASKDKPAKEQVRQVYYLADEKTA